MPGKVLTGVEKSIINFLKGYYRSGAPNLQAYFDELDEGMKAPIVKSLQKENKNFSSNISEELKQRYSHLLNEELLFVAEKGTIAQFGELLKLGADSEYRDKEGVNALGYAVLQGRYEFVGEIRQNFPEVSTGWIDEKLAIAGAKNDYETANKMLALGGNPYHQDKNGKTYFSYLLKEYQDEAFNNVRDYYLEKASEENIDKVKEEDAAMLCRELVLAVVRRDILIMNELVKMGAHHDKETLNRELFLAASRGDTKTFLTMIKLGAEINELKYEGESIMLELGAEITEIKNKGESIFVSAVRHQHYELAKYIKEVLERKGLGISGEDQKFLDMELSDLMGTAKGESKHRLGNVLSLGANPNTTDEKGNPIVFTAVDDRDVDTLKFLVERRAGIYVKNLNGNTLLSYTMMMFQSDFNANPQGKLPSEEIVSYLLEIGAEITEDVKKAAGKEGNKLLSRYYNKLTSDFKHDFKEGNITLERCGQFYLQHPEEFKKFFEPSFWSWGDKSKIGELKKLFEGEDDIDMEDKAAFLNKLKEDKEGFAKGAKALEEVKIPMAPREKERNIGIKSPSEQALPHGRVESAQEKLHAPQMSGPSYQDFVREQETQAQMRGGANRGG